MGAEGTGDWNDIEIAAMESKGKVDEKILRLISAKTILHQMIVL